LTEDERVEKLVGKDKGQVINWMAGEATRDIMTALESGSKKLEKI